MKEIFIYALKCPITDEIRYVGKTTNLNRRYNAHIKRCNQNKYHSANWIRSLIENNLKPILITLEICNDKNWDEKEKFWIKYYKALFDLTNFFEGGQSGGASFGRLGKKNSPEHIAKSIAGRKGKTWKQKTDQSNRKKSLQLRFEKCKKPILQYDLEGNLIKEWDCAVTASLKILCNHSNITACCKNKRKKCGEYMWKFKKGQIENKIESYNRIYTNKKK